MFYLFKAKEENHYLKLLDEEISSIFSAFKAPPNYACVLKRKIKPPVLRKNLTSDEISQKLKSSTSKPKISSQKIPGKSQHDPPQVAQLDFIPLPVKSEASDSRDFEPRIDLDSIYLLPNFKTVPRNPNKMKKRKRKN